MKKLLLTMAITAGLAGSAIAADIPAKSPRLMSAPVVSTNWTGCYVGAGGGYGMFSQKTQFVNGTNPFGLSHDNSGHGWFGTAQIGCDYQVGSNFVIGAFADYDFSGIRGDMSVAVAGWAGEEKLKHSWAAGGRVGWLPSEQLLVFVSGGYTQARFGQVDFNVVNPAAPPTNQSLSQHTYSGWFVGSGYEYALGWLPGLFWKTEYRFATYGTDRVQIFTRQTGNPNDSLDLSKQVHTVRSELVWRFNWASPVVARY